MSYGRHHHGWAGEGDGQGNGPGRRHPMREAWPAFDSWQQQVTKGPVRIGDTERDEAAKALGEHFAAGRLDRAEYDARLDTVLAAKTWGEIAPVFRDLPSPAPRPRTASRPARPPVPPLRASRPLARVPFLPVLLILIGVSVLLQSAWVFWIGLGVFWLVRRGHRSGSCRPPRGSWS